MRLRIQKDIYNTAPRWDVYRVQGQSLIFWFSTHRRFLADFLKRFDR